MSHVYLPHLEPEFGHAGHYTGYTTRDDVEEHASGRGAVMLRHENKIKGRSVRPLCPICKELGRVTPRRRRKK